MLKLIDEAEDAETMGKLEKAWPAKEDIETNIIDFELLERVSFDNFSSDYVFADDYI